MNKIITMELPIIIYANDSDDTETLEEMGIEQETKITKMTVNLLAITSFSPDYEADTTIVYMEPLSREVDMAYEKFKKIYEKKKQEYNA